MSRVLPILFNTEMVRAILDGRKTVTRRLVKHDTESLLNSPYCQKHPETPACVVIERLCIPPYQPGDILYVRETYQECCRNMIQRSMVHDKYCYKASVDSPLYGCVEECGQICKWKPSIHMPKEAARIWLKVTDVRVERLQDITAEQCIKEGVEIEALKEVGSEFVKGMFHDIWDSTIKKSAPDRYSWGANPWVWVIEFERCEKLETYKEKSSNGTVKIMQM